MRSFFCPACKAPVYFDNLVCNCGEALFYEPEARAMWNVAAPCANRDTIGCNWVAIPNGPLCRSCAMSDVVPALNIGDNRGLLTRAEGAKRRMLANLSNWNWFNDADRGPRPRFLMLSEDAGGARTEQIVMGHANGDITINVTEADALTRLQRQQSLGEDYRAMIGHFRHEMAHFLFDRLSQANGFSAAFRALFGDERADYAAALDRHYAAPSAPGKTHITAYATAHPHEDWAETVAHLLHLVDITDSFVHAGLTMPGIPAEYSAYHDPDANRLLTLATAVVIAINDINRALDKGDLYPFILTPKIREKMIFAHDWLMNHTARGA